MPDKINAFDVLKEMGARDLDIALGTDVLSIRKVKAGTKFEIGIGGDWVGGFISGDRRALLIVYNTEQYRQILAEMEKKQQTGESTT